MHLFVRLLGGIAALVLAGFVWTSVVERDRRPEPQADSPIEGSPPGVEAGPTEPVPQRAASGRATGNPGGLPARGARTGSAASTASARAAVQPTFTAPIAPAPSAQPAASPNPARTRREAATGSASTETSNQPSAPGEPNAPPEKERSSDGIGGSVMEKSGAPAPGLTVGLKARRVFNAAASSAPQTATTDGRGRFTFGAVADGEYEISTEKTERYERASTLVRAGTDSAVLIVEPKSDNTISIRGVVESTSGRALEGVRVDVTGQSITAVTDSKGAYALRIPAGARAEQAALRFRRTGYRDRRWTVADGQRSGDYEVIGNVRLEPDTAGVSVTGVVTSTSGAPVARAQVQLMSAARARSYRAVSDADGRFTLTNVDGAADYRLWVRPHSGFKDRILENILVDSATASLDVQVTPIGSATLTGRMVTPDGALVPGFTMLLYVASGAKTRLPVTSDPQGRFVVPDLPEGSVTLQTQAAPSLSVSGIELAANAAGSDVTVVIDVGPHRFDGRLSTGDGAPAPGVSVSLEWVASTGSVTSRSSRQTVTDADGNFSFTQLGGGVHVVSAALAGAGSVRLEHSVGASTEPVQLTLPGKRGRQ